MAVNLFDHIWSIDLKILHIRGPCNTHSPITRIIAFSGLKKVMVSENQKLCKKVSERCKEK